MVFYRTIYLYSLHSALLGVMRSLGEVLVPFMYVRGVLGRRVFRGLLGAVVSSIGSRVLGYFLVSASRTVSVGFVFRIVHSFRYLCGLYGHSFFQVSLGGVSSLEAFRALCGVDLTGD